MGCNLSRYLVTASSRRWTAVLVVLLIGATAADLFVPQRMIVQEQLADSNESDEDDSEPTESPAEDDFVGLCDSSKNRVRRQHLVLWVPVIGTRPDLPRRGRLTPRKSTALARRNGIGGPLR